MKLIIDVPENIIEGAKSSPNYYPIYHFEKMWRAIINGMPLDNLRAEIESIYKEDMECDECSDMGMVLDIIDKYKGE